MMHNLYPMLDAYKKAMRPVGDIIMELEEYNDIPNSKQIAANLKSAFMAIGNALKKEGQKVPMFLESDETMLNENKKVTLTIGQLKKLIKETIDEKGDIP